MEIIWKFSYANLIHLQLKVNYESILLIGVIKVEQGSHPESYYKSFVMKIKDRSHFDLICDSLPSGCGARWFRRRRFSPDYRSGPLRGSIAGNAYNRRTFNPETPSATNFTSQRQVTRSTEYGPTERGPTSQAAAVPSTNVTNGIKPFTSSPQTNAHSVPNFRIGQLI